MAGGAGLQVPSGTGQGGPGLCLAVRFAAASVFLGWGCNASRF